MPVLTVGNLATYLIVIERAEDGGFGAWAPDLPGCVALGDTPEACEREMREAMTLHVESLREHGEEVPQPTMVAVALVDVPNA